MGNLITPKRVQKLQTALHAKAKAEAGYPKSGSWLGCPLCDAGWDNRGLRFRRG